MQEKISKIFTQTFGIRRNCQINVEVYNNNIITVRMIAS